MRKIGLIGGTSPESTVLYYSHLVELSRKHLEKDVYPEIVIYSVNFKEVSALMRGGKREKLAEKFSEIFKWMEGVGVEIGALTANTMHLVFDMIETSIELVHIVDSTVKEAKKKGYKKLTLFGTKKTMESDMYPKKMAEHGIEIIVPDEEDRERINSMIFEKLVFGKVDEDVKREALSLAEKYLKVSDAIILGCTELPLAFEGLDIPKLDTTYIHAKDIFERAVRT